MSPDIVMIARAADFAARKHVDQRRKGAKEEPYINHLAEVALLLAETGAPAPLVAAGWLHDTIEDCGVTFETLEQTFGHEVASLVRDVSDDKSLDKAERKRLQIEHAADVCDAAKCLKIADKTSNLRALHTTPPRDWSQGRIDDYIGWAQKVVAGCRGVNGALDGEFDEAVTGLRDTRATR